MNEISNVNISIGPLTAFNALIGAKLRGNHFSDTGDGLSWMMGTSFNNPDSAPRGQNNPTYTGGMFLEDMDPTCKLGLASAIGTFRNQLPSVAYTRHIAGLQALISITPQLMGCWQEYCILAQKAIEAQKAIQSGSNLKVDDYRNVRYHDGAITEFLIATGDIYGREINYPEYESLDVARIFETVKSSIEPYLGSFDYETSQLASKSLSQCMGIGTTPGTGASMALLSAGTFDMLRNPWTRILANPAAFKICRPYFEDRLETAMESLFVTEEAKLDEDGFKQTKYISLIESTGEVRLKLEGYTPGMPISELADNIHQAVMGKDPLATSKYTLDDLTSNWLDQFYTTGDLVEAIFVDNTVDVLTPSALCVLLTGLATDEYSWQGANRRALVQDCSEPARSDMDSGALASISPVNKGVINVLCGTTIANFSVSGNEFTSIKSADVRESEAGACYLPNGTLDMGRVANTTMISWIRLVEYLHDALPNDLRILLQRTGRGMRTLPGLRATNLRDSANLIAGMITSGVRDGFLATASVAFSITRPGRVEQDGPMLANTTHSSNYPQGGSISVCTITRAGDWDTVAATSSMAFVNPFGSTVRIEALPGRFVGSWDAGRWSTYLPALFQASTVSGPNVAPIIADNLNTWPMARRNDEMAPMDIVIGSGIKTPFTDVAEAFDSPTKLGMMYSVAKTTTGTVKQTCEAWENQHPVHGFIRGLAAFTPADVTGRVKDTLKHRCRGKRGTLETTQVVTDEYKEVYTSRSGTATDYSGIYVTIPYASGLMKYDEYADPESEASHFFVKHMWDPNRINLVGKGNHRWKGTGFVQREASMITPHPYATEPISVHTWVSTLKDINTDINQLTNTERNVHAMLIESLPHDQTELAASFSTDNLVARLGSTTYAHESSEGRVESLDGAASGTYVTGHSDRWPARVAGPLMKKFPLNGGAVSATGTVIDPTAGLSSTTTYEGLDSINPIQLSFVVDSGVNQRHNAFSTRTLNPADGVDQPCTSSLRAGTLMETPAPLYVEGENIFMVGDANKTDSAANQAPFTTVMIQGLGFSPRGDLVTKNLMDVQPWLEHTYSELDPTFPSTFMGPVPVAVETGVGSLSLGGVRTAKVGVTQFGVEVAAAQVWRSPARGTMQVNAPWFSKGAVLTLREELARANELVNPWVRGEKESGLLHLLYTPSDVLPLTRVSQDRLKDISNALIKGLDHSLFMEIQIAN